MQGSRIDVVSVSMTSPLFAFRCSCYDIPNVSLLKANRQSPREHIPPAWCPWDLAVGDVPACPRPRPPTARLHSPSRRLSTACTPRPPAPGPPPAALNPSSPVGPDGSLHTQVSVVVVVAAVCPRYGGTQNFRTGPYQCVCPRPATCLPLPCPDRPSPSFGSEAGPEPFRSASIGEPRSAFQPAPSRVASTHNTNTMWM
jgi:hypothetical protein